MSQNKIVVDLFALQPSQRLEFFEIYYDKANQDNPLRIHNGQKASLESDVLIDKPIVYKGNTYLPCAFETSDFEINGDNRLPRPKLKLFNHIGDSDAGKYFFSALFQQYDPVNRKVVRKTTLLPYLDSENFEGGINPHKTDGIQRNFPDDVFFIYRKISENKLFLEFELACALELENVKLPQRQVNSKYCSFKYRGQGCLYAGKACLTASNKQFKDSSGAIITIGADKGVWSIGKTYSKGDIVKIRTDVKIYNQDISADNPSTYVYDIYVCISDHVSTMSKNPEKNGLFWTKDDCSKNIAGCEARHSSPLPFGGFVGTYKYSY